MTEHTQTTILPYSPQQLFDLIADIESYPEFLPWCKAARIIERNDDALLAELVIVYKGFREAYTSRVTLGEPNSIYVEMVKGPFNHLINRWDFTETADGTEIKLFLDFAFKSRILDKMMGGFFTRASLAMTDAFTEQAHSRYGA